MLSVFPPPTVRTTASPGRLAAQSTHPPCGGAVYVVMKRDSPPSTLRLIDFMNPPCILASTATPSDVAIIAPDSARTASPPAMVQRTTANDGVCLT